MMPLAKLQQEFQSWVYAGEGEFIKKVAAPPQGSCHERLMIYHHAYYSRLVDIVTDDYPKLHALLGDEVMLECIQEYVRLTPSQHFSVRYYGEKLSEFLQSQSPYSEVPLLAEMAEFEWALSLSLDAEDAPCLPLQDLSAIPLEKWESVIVCFHPSVSYLPIQHGVNELWLRIEADPNNVQPIASERQACFVWRYELQSYFVAMDALSGEVWRRFQQGQNFAVICQWLSDKMATVEIAEYIAGLLRYWLEEGLVTKLVWEES